MSRDPYDEVRSEVETALSNVRALHASYLRLVQSSSSSSLRSEAYEELQVALDALDGDLEDLEFSVIAVEESGDRWGVSDGEVRRRRSHLDAVVKEVQSMKDTLASSNSGGSSSKGKQHAEISSSSNVGGRYRDDVPSDPERGTDRERDRDRRDIEGWDQQEQETLMHRQDNTLSIISGTLTTLAQQAGLIGQEVGEQTEMLDDLSNRVDATDSRLTRANKRMREFIRRNEETKSGWCIAILIVILIILLLLVIIT